MSIQSDLGGLGKTETADLRLTALRWILPIGWCLAATGFLGPWISHPTAALSLAGVDMSEFVKFLPGVVDGSLKLIRLWFYLPPFAVTVSIALLVGSRRLDYAKLWQALGVLLAIPVSLQLLPPAWSPGSLMTAEFRAQALAIGISWLLLATFWLVGRLPPWLSGSLSAALCLSALVLPLWQYLTAKPAIDEVYGVPPSTGWGLLLCLAGLTLTTAASALIALTTNDRAETLGAGS